MRLIKLSVLFGLLVFAGCKNEVKDPPKDNPKPPKPKPRVSVQFDADSAYKYVAEQVAFGPRVPGTGSHAQTKRYLLSRLVQFCDTAYLQSGVHVDKKGRGHQVQNVIGQFNPQAKRRFALAAHWDTRPQADEDPNEPTKPADGANDGASGVGVLIEIARQLQQLNPALGIDIIFFDQEDGGENGGDPATWCIGSQYWGNQVVDNGYNAQNGILLDMVGAKNATFAHEQYSVGFNPNLLVETWRTAQQLGYGAYFVNARGTAVTDDHLFMSQYGGVPTIDIIHYDLASGGGFPDHWHTLNDNMDAIDANTLKAVGHTVLQVVMNHNQKL